ncbi:hypothetical protein M422DRAFT_265150 [Sphaerobolus stellatus SS14]|uniref:Uncharacterized protein n=1 Tax=Sphaerobolus stellatus (strain SS14) TaxID=990650 RepID=A0A0C9TS02_SPHS4|nr:hypothetical protein M422DRAFT_265150 [Sphaerobolus stellatus SS14]
MAVGAGRRWRRGVDDGYNDWEEAASKHWVSITEAALMVLDPVLVDRVDSSRSQGWKDPWTGSMDFDPNELSLLERKVGRRPIQVGGPNNPPSGADANTSSALKDERRKTFRRSLSSIIHPGGSKHVTPVSEGLRNQSISETKEQREEEEKEESQEPPADLLDNLSMTLRLSKWRFCHFPLPEEEEKEESQEPLADLLDNPLDDTSSIQVHLSKAHEAMSTISQPSRITELISTGVDGGSAILPYLVNTMGLFLSKLRARSGMQAHRSYVVAAIVACSAFSPMANRSNEMARSPP